MERLVYAKAGPSGEWTLDVLGVPFGGPFQGKDRAGDYFDAKSNVHSDKFPRVPVVYAHGLDPVTGKKVEAPQYIGIATYSHADEKGHWYKVILNKAHAFAKRVWESALKGIAGASSGTVNYLVRRAEDGHLDHWPVVEMTLTDGSGNLEPVNPYAVALPALKAVYLEAGIEIDESQVAGDAIVSGDGAAQNENTNKSIEGATMADEVKKEEPVKEEAKAQVPELGLLDDVLKDYQVKQNEKKEQDEMKAKAKDKLFQILDQFTERKLAPTINDGGPAVKRVTDRGFKDDATKSFMHFIRTGDDVPYKAAMQGQTDSEGGYAVPDDFYNQVIAKRNELSVARRMGVQVFPTSLDRILVPAEGTAATKFVVAAEEGAYDENEPTLGQVIVTIHKMTKLIKISEELEVDAKANFTGWLSDVWGRALALAENYYFVGTGTGTGMPQAMLVGATTSGITAASTTAITAAELLQLIYTMPSAYTDRLALVMRRATLGGIRALTGNFFSFLPTPAGTGAAGSDGDIHGIPVYTTDAMPASTAALKPILLVNPSFYAIGEREGLTVQRNPYLYQANGQIGLFSRARLGGAVLQAEALYYVTMHA